MDPSNPRDLIDTYLLRMDKVRFGRGVLEGREENLGVRGREGKGVKSGEEGEERPEEEEGD